jgi:hypothetical protein
MEDATTTRVALPRSNDASEGDRGGIAASANTIAGRIRGASISIINANPQLGMWQATGTAIAAAPNLAELREPESGGANIEFNAQGHSARTAVQEPNGDLALVKSLTRVQSRPIFRVDGEDIVAEEMDGEPRMMEPRDRRKSLTELHSSEEKAGWGTTILNGLKAFWKFFLTPSGFLITIYALNIVVSDPTHDESLPRSDADICLGMGREYMMDRRPIYR